MEELEKAEVVEQEKRWCRFCKYFLDGGTVFAEEFLPNDHITHEAAEPICERYRQMVSFYPYTCQFARDNEDLCGAAGKGYIECEDRYDALDDNLKGIESVKNGHGPYIIPMPIRRSRQKPKKRASGNACGRLCPRPPSIPSSKPPNVKNNPLTPNIKERNNAERLHLFADQHRAWGSQATHRRKVVVAAVAWNRKLICIVRNKS